MRRMILGLMAMMFCVAAIAADADKPGDKPTPTPTRVSIFSTSTDWSAVTGLPWAQYEGNFSPDKKLIGPQGLVLFFLDSFPCYGEADSVRVWISPRGQVDGRLRLVCVHAPKRFILHGATPRKMPSRQPPRAFWNVRLRATGNLRSIWPNAYVAKIGMILNNVRNTRTDFHGKR